MTPSESYIDQTKRLRDIVKKAAKAAASRVSIDFFLVTAFKFSACELDFIKKTKRWKWWISDEIKKIVYFRMQSGRSTFC